MNGYGVASHVARTYRWFQTAHQADKDGPLKGVPYDGTDPQYRDLYGVPCQVADTNYAAWNVDCDYEQLRDVAPPEWERQFERRMRDLLDRYEPDLYYVDGGIPFHVHLLWVTLAGNASLAGAESGFRHSEPAESRKNTPESVQRSNALVRLDQASATGNGVKLTVAGATTAKALRNPVWTTSDNIRDPSVLKVGDGYYLCYSRFTGTNWGSPSNWTIGSVFTKDFRQYDESREISPKGYASPGDVVYWHGRYLLPYQSYPAKPTLLCVSESLDLHQWTSPKTFLAEAADLPWNTYRRVIDPSFVVEGGLLHCYFVGSADVTNAAGRKLRANLLGHAITRDPRLERWEVLTPKVPLLGVSDRAPDGVENVMVFRTGDHWTMIFSEGLADQHLALAVSNDLRTWKLQGPLEIPRQKWMARKYGAPFVWRDGDAWRMILMGENAAGKTTFGLLSSPDGKQWTLLPEP